MDIRLGFEPLDLGVTLTAGSDFLSSLVADTARSASTAIALTVGDTTWPATLAGPRKEGPTMITTEHQADDGDMLTTSAAPPDDLLTTERVDANRQTDAAACNLPGCEEVATTRGLCDGHWSTHRGLADPNEQAPEQNGEVAFP